MTKVTFENNSANGKLVGYARVSTAEQTLDMQIQALIKAGVPQDQIWSEKRSASAKERKELERCLKYLEKGDTLVVWKLDRLGRSMLDLMKRLQDLKDQGLHFVSLTEQIDTSTPGGQLLLHVLMALAQFERDLIRQRTTAGMAAKKATGWIPGPRRKLTPEQEQQVINWVEKDGYGAAQVVEEYEKMYGTEITRRLVYLTLKRHRESQKK